MNEETLEFTDQLSAELVEYMGNDLTIINAARVSLNQHSDEWSEKDTGLLRFLMKNRHASPFEHCVITFLIDAPITVAREWHRHRTQSFNEVSGRYTILKPKFYVPNQDRPLVQQGKPGAYYFTPGNEEQYKAVKASIEYSCGTAWVEYKHLLEQGVAKEVARSVLPVNTYTSWYATANLRNWANFLSLRTDETAMHEIRQLAFEVETKLHRLYPATMNAWDEFGRGGL